MFHLPFREEAENPMVKSKKSKPEGAHATLIPAYLGIGTGI